MQPHSQVTIEAKSTISGRMLSNPVKKDQTQEFFQDSRVNSCSYVRLKKGTVEAVPFYQIANQNLVQDNDNRSIYTSSYSHDVFKVRPNLHVGSQLKTLEPYHPTCFRNRLPVEDAPILTKNASQVEIGERNFNVKKHFLSTAHNVYGNFGKFGQVTNPGILSEKTKWHHHKQAK